MQPPQQNHVILLGSSARAATASAIAAGLQVTAVDAFGDADLREMCQLYQPLSSGPPPLAFLRSQRPSTLVPLGGCERWIDSIASLGDHHRIAGPTAEQWRLVNELSVLREIASAAAIRFPESYAYADVGAGIRPTGHGPSHDWLIKMPSSCGGLGVRWAEKDSIAPGELYQRWIRGMSIGASYLGTGEDVRLLGVCRGLRFPTASQPAIYAGSCGPLHLRPECAEALVRLGQAAANRLQLRGLFNIDLILHPIDGLYLLEINPRYTASMELLEPTGGAMKTEPTALAAGPDATISWQARPEVCAYGSERSELSSAQPIRDVVSPREEAIDGDHSTHRTSLLAAHLQCVFGPLTKGSRSSAPADRDQRVRCKRVVFTRQRIIFSAGIRRGLQAILKAHSAQWADIPAEGTTILGQRPLLSIFTEADSAPTAYRKAARIARAMRPVYEAGASVQ